MVGDFFISFPLTSILFEVITKAQNIGLSCLHSNSLVIFSVIFFSILSLLYHLYNLSFIIIFLIYTGKVTYFKCVQKESLPPIGVIKLFISNFFFNWSDIFDKFFFKQLGISGDLSTWDLGKKTAKSATFENWD